MTSTRAAILLFAVFAGLEVMADWGDKCGSDCKWKELNGKCYYLSDAKLTWGDARRFCKEMGGDLAVVPDYLTNNFIKKLRIQGSPVEYVWIGLTGSEEEGKFTWVDDQEYSFTNWGDGQPNSILNPAQHEICVDIHVTSTYRNWGTGYCYWPRYFVCQRTADGRYFVCSDGHKIPQEWTCDRNVDCVDAGDELNCDNELFECSDGRNIPKKWTCDLNVDCIDAGDELNC